MSDEASQLIIPVILSGGAGTRLWPLSRGSRPKQMLALTGMDSMLALTARRVSDGALFAAPIIVAAADQADAIEAQVPGLSQLILEPVPRNTAPAIALAALAAAPDALLLVLPSDHLIGDPAGLAEAAARAAPFAREGWIVTFGMKPERAETGYGYIERGATLGGGVHAAVRFIEKPDAATAGRYAASGRHEWNGGIFLLSAATALGALNAHAPQIVAAAQAAMALAAREGGRLRPDAPAFAAAPAISFDHAVMEKADKVAVVPVAIGWSDVGSWEALFDLMDKDEDGNVVVGKGLAIDASGCLIRAEGPMVAAIGVHDLVIVATADAVLIVPRAQSQRVREAVDALKAEGRGDLL